MSNMNVQSNPVFQEQTQGQYLTTFQRKLLLKELESSLSKQHQLRIQIMLLADEGKTQAQICQILECAQSTARYWISKARAGLAHDWTSQPIGRPKAANTAYLERLKELVNQSPKKFGYSFRQWTAKWLSKHLLKELGIHVSDRHINRLLKEMGLSTRQKVEIGANTQPELLDNPRVVIRDLTSVPKFELTEFWMFSSPRH